MRPRAKRRTTKQKQNFKKKSTQGKGKQRKTYSLYKTNQQDAGKGKKRAVHEYNDKTSRDTKRKKIEEKYQKPLESSEESEEEYENHMKQLLDTFNSHASNKSKAIDSSDDSSSENESANEDANDLNDTGDGNNDLNDGENLGNTELSKLDDAKIASESHADVEVEDDGELGLQDENVDVNTEDPFANHLFYEMNDSLLNSVQSTPMLADDFTETWPVLGKLHGQIPKCEATTQTPSKYSIAEEKKFAPKGTPPTRIDVTKQTSADVHIKMQIVNNISTANKSFDASTDDKSKKIALNDLQSEIFSVINNYQDFYDTRRTFENAEQIRFVYCLHAVNHILKTRMKVVHHNARLTKKDDVPEEFRDQGLVRPKILMIVPFRDAAHRIISMLIDILVPGEKGNVMNKTRFIDEYTGHEVSMPKKNPKPDDYEQMFSGNSGDDFRVGITVTKKSLKLFADFYAADIIIASPLGLRTIIGAEGEPERDFDFLASIELLILDQIDIFMMQNWDHVLHIFNHLHLQPKESHGTDFARVRTWSLNGWAKYYRQTLIFSSVVLPEVNAVFNKKCFNYAGKVRTVNSIEQGSICQVFVQLPHVFQKFSADSVGGSADARFQFFINKVLPQQRETLMKQTLIFVSNYFDYVRLRNYFKREDIGFVQICEYSKDAKVARARDMFFHGDSHFLLYTQRYHFFHRIRVKGIRHLLFYQPPLFPHLYYEMCNLMQETNMNKKVGSISNMTVTVLYSKYDVHQLAAVVGTERAAKMVQSERNVHMFVTDAKQSSNNTIV